MHTCMWLSGGAIQLPGILVLPLLHRTGIELLLLIIVFCRMTCCDTLGPQTNVGFFDGNS